MKVVLQRVTEASVRVNGEIVGSIGAGLLLLVGIHTEDTAADADWLIKKVADLRVFSDPDGKMNLSVRETGGALLCISQFTLLADYKKGNRPSYIQAARPEVAVPLFEYFKKGLSQYTGLQVESGVFGADMKVSLLNDGPVTLVLDSKTKA